MGLPREDACEAPATWDGGATMDRCGDAHVAPAVLFDVEDPAAGPPAGSIDVQFRSPVSLSVMLDGMDEAGLDRELDIWAAGYRDLAGRLLRRVQVCCGYVRAVEDGGAARQLPARLELAAVIESVVPGFEQARWHCHVYVGPTALTLADGVRRPVDVDAVRLGAETGVEGTYISALWALAERQLEVTWGPPEPGAEHEIIEPPWHEYIGAAERGVCPGRWSGMAETVVADARALRQRAAQRQLIPRQREIYGNTADPDWRAAREALGWGRTG